MTAAEFRKEALAVPGAVENTHMAHPDFRLRGKVFASVGYPGPESAMVKLTPEQQREFIRKAAHVFSPVAGAWGRSGCTRVQLSAATTPVVRPAVRAAAKNIEAKYPRPAGFNP